MRCDNKILQRKSIRLNGYDYTKAGFYFITLCTFEKECLFGDIIYKENENPVCKLNNIGKIVRKSWLEIPEHFPYIKLDEFIIMPNHVHGILKIKHCARANIYSPLLNKRSKKFKSPSRTLGSVTRGFKIGVTKWVRDNTEIYYVWQRNYYDRILRNERELYAARQYIMDNPKNWKDDEYNI